MISILDFQGSDKEIFWQLRVPRTIIGFIIGASLGLAGAVFQTIFKNPLASPYTLGVASASAFGATLAIVLGLESHLLLLSIVFSIFASLMLVICKFNSNTLLLFGVALGLMFSSASIFLSYLSDPMQNYQLSRWLMGGLNVPVSEKQIIFLTIVFLTSLGFGLSKHRGFDLILAGEDLAITRGLNIVKLKRITVFVLSILIGVVVSLAGPIGFLGILVPHFCRAFGSVSHKQLLPRTVLLAGSLLVFCDYLSRSLVYPAEIPVGVITALVGAPVFIVVLLRRANT